MISGPSTAAVLLMICQGAAKRWHRVSCADRLAEVVKGERFIDGEPAYAQESAIAAR